METLIPTAQMITLIISILIPMIAGFAYIAGILFRFESRISKLEAEVSNLKSEMSGLKSMMQTLLAFLLERKTGTHDK